MKNKIDANALLEELKANEKEIYDYLDENSKHKRDVIDIIREQKLIEISKDGIEYLKNSILMNETEINKHIEEVKKMKKGLDEIEKELNRLLGNCQSNLRMLDI